MKKYFFIFKSELMSHFQYISDILIGFIGYIIHVFIFLNLWKYLYSDPNQLINGYSMNQMIWYVIITEIVWSICNSRAYVRKISNDVKTGNVAYNINKPYSYIGYVISDALGASVVKGVIYTILGILLGFIFIGSFPQLNFIQILLTLIIAIFAIIIGFLIATTIGLFSFFIEDASPFYWLYSKLILIVGVVFPIEYFPKFIQPVLTYSPVYVISYAPAKLFVDFKYSVFFMALFIQIIYVILISLLCNYIYKKGEKKLNVNGG